ncbi:HpcH/HpaI aldolase/citrate lyase family protein [Clostridiaceae bacterium M8S5]|nr:HpcH/HpaI aldolase/citrate lyase family protein [Clostridiaceae bacterium M8S5]
MKYFNYLEQEQIESIFYKKPQSFYRHDDRDKLAYALGATLYMPATRNSIVKDIKKIIKDGLMTIVLCLEDAIGDNQVKIAEQNLIRTVEEIDELVVNNQLDKENIPLLFIRVRSAEQMKSMASMIGDNIDYITGFVFPKFTSKTGEEYFRELKKINENTHNTVYGMPILEGKEIIYVESRKEELAKLSRIFENYRELVLNIRIGATDFCSLFGIRRSYDKTIYDIQVIRDCIGDIVNTFTRIEKDLVVSAPVWEYFSSGERLLKPQLRVSPFTKTLGKEAGKVMRTTLLNQYIDGLLREVELDKTNGLLGKTIIHPSHILPVQSMLIVTHEEYTDAVSIMNKRGGDIGVFKSEYKNKMNEIKPHINWAKKILNRAKLYGVFNEGMKYIDIYNNKSL